MNRPALSRALDCAIDAAHQAGQLMRANHRSPKKVHAATAHDIKLELDVRCQKRIEAILLKAFPRLPILGEEGALGPPDAPCRWVVDPIDGTVNFAHGIPHCCVSIALQRQRDVPHSRAGKPGSARSRQPEFETLVGVVYDPFCDELFTGRVGDGARLNGRPIHASQRGHLADSLVSVGFAKERATVQRMIPVWHHLIRRVRKIRMMGAAALGLAYVASGRLDAYLEYGLRLWDIAAGGLLVDCAGGSFWTQLLRDGQSFHVIASNRSLAAALERFRRLPP